MNICVITLSYSAISVAKTHICGGGARSIVPVWEEVVPKWNVISEISQKMSPPDVV